MTCLLLLNLLLGGQVLPATCHLPPATCCPLPATYRLLLLSFARAPPPSQAHYSPSVVLLPLFIFFGALGCCFGCLVCCGRLAAAAHQAEQESQQSADVEGGQSGPAAAPSNSASPTRGGSQSSAAPPSPDPGQQLPRPERLPRPGTAGGTSATSGRGGGMGGASGSDSMSEPLLASGAFRRSELPSNLPPCVACGARSSTRPGPRRPLLAIELPPYELLHPNHLCDYSVITL